MNQTERARDVKMKAILLALMMAAVVSCSADQAQSAGPVSPPLLVLTDEQDRYSLGLHMEILEDRGGELTIDDVSSPGFDSRFVASQVGVPNYGFTDSAYWVRLRLRNQTRLTEHWLLEAGMRNMQFVDLYTPLPAGEGFAARRTGALRPPDSRDIRDPRMVLNLDVPANSQQTFYVRFQSGTAMNLALTLWTPDAFRIQSQLDQLLRGLFFGALLVLLAYNLFLFLSLRERSYLYLVILLASMTVFEAGYAGYTEIYIVPRLYYLKAYYQAASFSLMFASMLLFTDVFLELKARFSKLHWVILAIVGAWGLLLLLTPFQSYRIITNLMVPWALLSLAVVLAAGTIAWLRGFRDARFFMIAWSGLLFAFFFTILARLGILSSTVISENVYHLGMVWMAVCWSIALADRINLLKADVQSSEHRLSQILEGLPLGVVVYGRDHRPSYANQRVLEILSNPARGIVPDLSAGRTLTEAIEYFSLRVLGSDEKYPMEKMPIYRALQGEPASVDDVEADLVDMRVPLEIWASPVKDDEGGVESAIVAFQDISRRKRAEAELDNYRTHLEGLVEERTALLTREAAERQLLAQMQSKLIEWLSVINEVHQSFGSTTDLPQSYERLLVTISQLLDAKCAFIGMWESQSDQFEVLCSLRPDDSTVSEKKVSMVWATDSLLRREIEQGELLILGAERASQVLAPLEPCPREENIQSVILAPIRAERAVTGLMGVGMQRSADTFADAEVALFERIQFDLAGLIEHARLYETVRALAATEERNRLARDLHDSVTQVLFSASLVGEVLPQFWRSDPALALEGLEELRRLTRGALAEMRTMLLELRPSSVLKTSLPELLAQLTEAVTSRSELSFQMSIEQIPSLPDDVHVTFYRIAQEALNNVVKHARASQVAVSLSTAPLVHGSTAGSNQEMKLVIADDGAGFSAESQRPHQMGLGIMHERAAAINAGLFVESEADHGTRVTLNWPNQCRRREPAPRSGDGRVSRAGESP